ncbi:hypothetical protein BN938_0125 [Mucinivorans hirudinis]|uniref:Uncharacterized protein n=1 Tax=Mucinivorans hirudinis TaxID=1433126 RepID=A0A060R5W8_9BACT|nr:hypothetical protein BN938_0125 [Mucinivorans hirudinis]
MEPLQRGIIIELCWQLLDSKDNLELGQVLATSSSATE